MSRYVATDSIWMGTATRKHQKISHHITGMVSMSQRGNEVLYSCGPPEPYYVRISQCKFGGLIDCDWKEMACCKRDIQDQAQRCCGPWKNMDWPALVVLACFACIAFEWLVLSQPTQPAQPNRIRESASADLAASQCSWMNVAQLPSLGIFVSRYISNNMERIFQIWAIGQTKIWSWSKHGDWKRMASSLYPCFDDLLGWIWVNRWPDSVARCCKWVESRSQIRWLSFCQVCFAQPMRWEENYYPALF